MTEHGVVTSIARSPVLFHVLRSMLDPGQPGRLRAFLRDTPHVALHELGCGIGANCIVTNGSYTGIDLDPGYIAYASRRFGSDRRRFVAGDLLAPLDAVPGPWDLVALLNVAHHLADDEVRDALRHARTAGARRVLVVDVALERTGVLFRTIFGPLDRGTSFRSADEIRRLLATADVVIEREDGWSTGPGIWPRAAFIGRFV